MDQSAGGHRGGRVALRSGRLIATLILRHRGPEKSRAVRRAGIDFAAGPLGTGLRARPPHRARPPSRPRATLRERLAGARAVFRQVPGTSGSSGRRTGAARPRSSRCHRGPRAPARRRSPGSASSSSTASCRRAHRREADPRAGRSGWSRPSSGSWRSRWRSAASSAFARELLRAALGNARERADPREGARAGAPPLRGLRRLRQDAERAARGLHAPALARVAGVRNRARTRSRWSRSPACSCASRPRASWSSSPRRSRRSSPRRGSPRESFRVSTWRAPGGAASSTTSSGSSPATAT